MSPRIATDMAGGALVTWNDYRYWSTSPTVDVYAQRITADGGTVLVD